MTDEHDVPRDATPRNDTPPDESGRLASVLDTATDQIEGPMLATRVLREAHRRRTRRRTVAVGAVAASVVGVVAASQLADGDSGTPAPAGPSPTAPSPTPQQSEAPVDPPADPRDAVQPRWDPFTVADLPIHDTVLPAELAPPAEAPSVTDQPLEAAVVAWPTPGRDLMLLGPGGAWRSVPGTEDAVTGSLNDVVRPVLSHDGSNVAMSTDAGILVVDVTSGERTTIPWPKRLAGPWDTAPALLWLPDDAGFLVLHWKDTWRVDLSGTLSRPPYGGGYGLGLAVDPEGPVVERRWQQRDLRVFEQDQLVATSSFSYWGERLVSEHGLVALTGGGSALPGDGGPMVLDTRSEDLAELVAYAPIRDKSSVYTDNGYLTAQGFLDEDTVLLLVGPMDFGTMDPGEETWHLVAWQFRTGDFRRLSTGDPAMAGIDVAAGVLADGWNG